MVTYLADLRRLEILIQRMQDAELLLDADGARLLLNIEAARQGLAASNTAVARRHIEQIARFTEALVTTHALGLTDGHAVIEKAKTSTRQSAGPPSMPSYPRLALCTVREARC